MAIVLAVALFAITVAAGFVIDGEVRRRTTHEPEPEQPERIVAGLVRRKALVATKTGLDFSGVLVDADDTAILLRQAGAIDDTGTTPVDGEVLILRQDIAYIQLP